MRGISFTSGMNTRSAVTAMFVAAWVLWGPVALASHTGMAGRPMCAGPADSHAGSESPAGHVPAQDGKHMDQTAGELCSLGLCLAFISPWASAQFSLSSENHPQHPLQDLLMALLQVPDPVPKSLRLSA